MLKEQKTILNALLDKFEKSKTFLGENKVTQNISIKPEKVFPSYVDDSQYEMFQRVNQAVTELEDKKLIYVKWLRNGLISNITLNLEQLEESYHICNRVGKKDIQYQLTQVWDELARIVADEPMAIFLEAYVKDQKVRIKQNKQVSYFDGDFQSYEEMLMAIREIVKNDSEQFIRDFSVRVLGHSKKLEAMEERIRFFLYEYGECASKEEALEEYGIVKTPTHVSMKGQAILTIGDQTLDLSKIQGDISFSTISLAQIKKIEITAGRIVTIENLTSFHSFEAQNCFVVYLGGYHNRVKRDFLKKVYEDNPKKSYVHFGDIDAGGFYIYEHLIKRTGIPYDLLGMDVETLEKYSEFWQELTVNDRRRLQMLNEKEETINYHEVLQFMIEHNCKLEQEVVKL